jgi:CheY-like chemotaxis protein
MNTTGPLILVEDDADDHEMILLAFDDIGFKNEVRHFRDAERALDFLLTSTEKPFLIVSDINMPRMDGLEFKAAIESSDYLRNKSIPFVFLSTAATSHYINRAFELRAQGFFQKGSSYDHLKASVNIILDYWRKSKHPNRP